MPATLGGQPEVLGTADYMAGSWQPPGEARRSFAETASGPAFAALQFGLGAVMMPFYVTWVVMVTPVRWLLGAVERRQ